MAKPLDSAVQQRLRALLDLQGILQRQELTQDQLRLVRDQVSALAPNSTPVMSTPQPVPNAPPISRASVGTPPQQYQHLLNQNTLAGLIKATAARQQPTPPPQAPNAIPSIPRNSNTPQPAVPTPPDNPLIASLKARGLLPTVPSSSAPPAAPTPSAPGFPFMMPGQMHSTPPVPTPQTVNPADVTVNVQMNTASIKM